MKVLLAATFLLCIVTNARGVPTPIAKFTAANLVANEYIGYSIATDGQSVLLGTRAGTAFLYDPFTQQQLAKIVVPGAHDTSVALHGSVGVIGTEGRASLYDFSDLANIANRTLTPNDTTAFVTGQVDMSGDTIIVGARESSGVGTAYLFNRVTGTQFAKLAADSIAERNFSISVAIDGNHAVVGSPRTDSPFDSAVYLFDARPDNVGNRRLDKYIPADVVPNPNNLFGYNVDISLDTIVALKPNGPSFAWAATGEPETLPNSSQLRAAGVGISISEQLIAVAIPEQSVVKIYSPTGQFLRDLVAPPGSPIGFGTSVAVGGDLLVVSAGGGTPALSAAYIYRVQDVLAIPEPSMLLLTIAGFVVLATQRANRRTRGASDT